jgi:hypothetical protein
VAVCIDSIPEDGTPVLKHGDVIIVMNCVIWCVFYCILLCAFVSRYIEYTRIHDMGNKKFAKWKHLSVYPNVFNV